MKVNFKNVKYGQLVEVINDNGYHAGMKVHFFNQKGVLVGNIYQFVPYEKVRFRPEKYIWERKFLNKPFEKIRQLFYEFGCLITTILIRWTQIP